MQPDGEQPNHVALDEIGISLDDQRYWLYAADLETNEFLHVELYPTRMTALTSMLLTELREKDDVNDALFFVDSAPWLKAAFMIMDYNSDTKYMETRTLSNIYFRL